MDLGTIVTLHPTRLQSKPRGAHRAKECKPQHHFDDTKSWSNHP